MSVHVFPVERFAAGAARQIAKRLSALAEARPGPIALAISGGRTPIPVFEQFAGPLLDAVPWTRLEIFWCDERCVPPGDPDSNFGAANRSLLSQVPIKKSQIHRMRGELGAEAAAPLYDAELRATCGGALDLALLGVGADGHTASLFPGGLELEETARLAAGSRSPDGMARVTLTLPALSRAGELLVIAAGAGRNAVVQAALRQPGGPLPIQRLAGLKKLSWCLDDDAGAGVAAA